jgi:hypothetical protein
MKKSELLVCMGFITIFCLTLLLQGCAGVQIEGIKRTLPNGQVAECMPHPDRPGYLRCSYMDGANEIVIAIKQDVISGRNKQPTLPPAGSSSTVAPSNGQCRTCHQVELIKLE